MWGFTFKVERIQGPSETQRDHKHLALSLAFPPRNTVSSEQNIPCAILSSQIGVDATTQETGRRKEAVQLEQANTTRFESHKNPGHSEIRSLYAQWCRKIAHQLNPINSVSWSVGTDFRPTYSTTPSEEAGRDHSFLGLLSNSNTPTAPFNLQMCPSTFALTANTRKQWEHHTSYCTGETFVLSGRK